MKEKNNKHIGFMSENPIMMPDNMMDKPDIIIFEDNIPRCGYCENELEDKQNICGICGHKLDWRKR